MPYQGGEVVDEVGTETEMPVMARQGKPEKADTMKSMMDLMAKMKALMQEMEASKDMGMMSKIMSMMSAMEIMMKQMYGAGSHYQKEETIPV